jgi:voltage-gated potassium channel
MEGPRPQHIPGGRFMERRVQRTGLRPRVAASLVAILWLIAIAIFGVIEHLVDPDSFDTVWLGMWWATQTVTTVGYGDVVPDDATSRIIATILMVGGLSLFGVITGMIASAFVTQASAEQRAHEVDALAGRLDQVSAELSAIRRQLASIADDSPQPPAG